jgi:hypothetical protein
LHKAQQPNAGPGPHVLAHQALSEAMTVFDVARESVARSISGLSCGARQSGRCVPLSSQSPAQTVGIPVTRLGQWRLLMAGRFEADRPALQRS